MQINKHLKLILNFLILFDQKWTGLYGHGTKIRCISRRNRWNKLIFSLAFCYKFRKTKSYFSNFDVGVFKNRQDYLMHGTLKLVLYQE